MNVYYIQPNSMLVLLSDDGQYGLICEAFLGDTPYLLFYATREQEKRIRRVLWNSDRPAIAVADDGNFHEIYASWEEAEAALYGPSDKATMIVDALLDGAINEVLDRGLEGDIEMEHLLPQGSTLEQQVSFLMSALEEGRLGMKMSPPVPLYNRAYSCTSTDVGMVEVTFTYHQERQKDFLVGYLWVDRKCQGSYSAKEDDFVEVFLTLRVSRDGVCRLMWEAGQAQEPAVVACATTVAASGEEDYDDLPF